jgi:hypothetical protein
MYRGIWQLSTRHTSSGSALPITQARVESQKRADVKQPTIHDVKGPDSLNSSSILFYNVVVTKNFFGADPLTSPSHA